MGRKHKEVESGDAHLPPIFLLHEIDATVRDLDQRISKHRRPGAMGLEPMGMSMLCHELSYDFQ